MSTAIIFGTSQNNVWLVYIFVIFFQLLVYFHFGHVALLFFKVGYQNNCYQILKRKCLWKHEKKTKCCMEAVSEKYCILHIEFILRVTSSKKCSECHFILLSVFLSRHMALYKQSFLEYAFQINSPSAALLR